MSQAAVEDADETVGESAWGFSTGVRAPLVVCIGRTAALYRLLSTGADGVRSIAVDRA
ncbi:MAG: hypothetical protein AVDCRST_MAG10-1180 [uncultured Acidimicrobiales bacterium]|uniref:Uncharacterized protein n=1 Tax=uncultured Acidimicrobiales bacterium TaxID=310071 RepID=A0A6J4HRX2_9ACTN|nr:MAG: hypothetical protein AVDCRST_MAG10-1180 [uncultured Acidimicrobiales bacterium]